MKIFDGRGLTEGWDLDLVGLPLGHLCSHCWQHQMYFFLPQ
jgi:hypothetical protein